MTVCNYCEKRGGRSNKFNMPFTCTECENNHENYANNVVAIDDGDEYIITYIDANGKHINFNSNTELNIEFINDKPIDTNAFKTFYILLHIFL